MKGKELHSQNEKGIFVLCSVYTACGSRVMLINQNQFLSKYVLKSSTPYCTVLVFMSIQSIMALSFTAA